MDELTGRTAVITGAASGMGRAFADRFSAAGMNLVLADIEQAPLDDAVAELSGSGAQVIGVRTDVSDGDQVDALAAAAFERFETVNVVCNNAGVAAGGRIADLAVADWEWVLGVNVWGVVHGLRAFLPHLIAHGDGHVVNTASVAGHTSPPGMAPYNASKHAVVTISETLYNELTADGSTVGVTVLCPGLVSTRIMESDRNRPEQLPKAGIELSPEDELRRAAITELFAAAKPPAEVADLVHDAILAKQLYLFTDDVFLESIRTRHECIQHMRNPDASTAGLFD
ncbi:MAG TPA: SDR family NAD(P)-dependent oxidoreductase [Acidimicrobiales bacterium]|nr:SDR family NAD(P)-dependent oxidoreductase [Acidimicrobiales bacterium]